MDAGVCCNATCPKAGETVERYPGPGQYCPECGELLASAAQAGAAEPLSVEAYEAFQSRMQTALGPARLPSPWPIRAALAAALALVVAVIIVAALRTTAVGRAGSNPVAVCPSSITQRLASDLVHAYAAKTGTPASHFNVANTGACDVRFAAFATANANDAVAHDGVVVIVNPQNPLAELSVEQLRGIVSGGITDWSRTGAPRGAIALLLPADGTDEAQALHAVLRGAPIAASARRLTSSADIVRAVASASGRGMLGVVAFSAAVPAKVLALHAAPAPSVLSIADHRYPLSLGVTVDAQGSRADPAAAALIRYARSDEAQAIVVRDGLIAKRGF